jgi:hypothetical protein
MNITFRSATQNNRKTRAIIVSNPTVSSPYNLEYFAPAFQTTIACSQRGQYVSFCASGGIYSSSDYGATFSSIAVSTTGQYQACTSCGYGNGCVIYMSDNYGVTWNLRRNIGPNNGRYIEQVVISSTGQYVYCAGGSYAGLQSFYSKDYGLTFQDTGGIATRPTCSIFNDKVIFFCVYDRNIYSILLSASPPVETYNRQSQFLTYTQNIVTNSTGSIIIITYRDGNAFYISTDSGVTYTLVYTPSLYHLHIISGVIYGSSSTAIYKSIDYGVSWTVIFIPTGKTIKCMCGNITYKYMVYTSGEIAILTLS